MRCRRFPPRLRTFLWLLACWTAASLAALSPILASSSETPPEDFFEALEYRFIGPLGNRVIAVTGVPGERNVYYVGAASGGIFKTTDGGAHWRPIFDDQPAASIGSLAVAPSDPNVIWAGTGETFLRANVSIGNGIYRSDDGGETWRHMGLERTGRIGRVIVHPETPDIVYAAALGHCYGPQQERGIFRTMDGGITWERILFTSENAGASDLVMDPNNPRILFAGMWEMELTTWSRKSGGPGSGLFVSRDSGQTWERLEGHGLPEPPWGKIGLAMSADDSRRIYALIETNSNRDFAPLEETQGVLWRSDDGGKSWRLISRDNNLVQRPLYYSRAAVAPDDADEIHFMSVQHSISTDGGATVRQGDSGWDHHDMWIDPLLPERMIVGHDGGISISTNRGESWFRPQLPTAQMYHVHTDDQIPYFVYGNRQDGPSTRGPSNSLDGDTIPVGAWRSVGGCEVGFALPSREGNLVWTGCFDGILDLHDLETGHSRNVSIWPEAPESWPSEDLRYRFQWTFPLALSPHDPERVYAGSQYVHQTIDRGQSWQIISPDLTTDDPALQKRTGGLTLDDAGPTLAPTIFALAESPLEEALIWAGTNDGQVQLTRDGGATWSNVTASLPDLPPLGTISNLEPSRHAAGTCYLTVDRHQLGDSEPYVYVTRDYGATWRRLGSDLPRDVFGYAHCVREDPVRPGLLYLGTENALHVSFDDGERWIPLQTNLPRVPVHWLEIQEHFNDLVVATYGRGFWILDDITPLQQLVGELDTTQPRLFAPRPAYRFIRRGEPMQQPEDPAAGENPQYGASLHVYIPAAGESPEDTSLTILDGAGEVVRTLEDFEPKAGLQRVWWNLLQDKAMEVELRTAPDESPHTPMPAKGWRPLSDGYRIAPMVPPGSYTVRLTHGDETWEQTLEVRQDPSSKGNEEGIRQQTEMLFELRALQNEAARIINEIEWARKQIFDLSARLADRPEHAELLDAGRELDARLRDLEGGFFDLRLTGATQDTLRWKRLLYARLAHLAWTLSQDDSPPTDSQRQVFDLLRQRLRDHDRRFDELREETAAFNERLRAAGIGHVVMGQTP